MNQVNKSVRVQAWNGGVLIATLNLGRDYTSSNRERTNLKPMEYAAWQAAKDCVRSKDELFSPREHVQEVVSALLEGFDEVRIKAIQGI